MSDAFLAALDEDAREHRESFTGRKRSGSNISASNVPTALGPAHLGAAIPTRPAATPNRPAASLSAALEEDARELREEAFQNRRPSVSTPSIPISPRKGAAMASVFGNKRITLPGDLGPGDPRRVHQADDQGAKSRMSARSLSPRRSLATGTSSPAHRRLSDAFTRPSKGFQNDSEAPDGGVRLRKDYDAGAGSSDDEDTDRDNDSGRGRPRIGNAVDLQEDSEDGEDDGAPRGRKGNSEDAEDPKITVTPPTSQDASHPRRSDVHPSTAFDHAGTPVQSDDEHMTDLRRAQRLSLTISPIHSTPSAHRVIRQIIRGDYAYFQREAEEGRRRQRVYLVATDLSSEAEYALEWTIGTVLRDGDTLLAVYAVDEEGGTGGASEGVEIGHGVDVVKDTASIVRSLTAENVSQDPLPRDNSTARIAYGERDGMNKAERERFRAAEDISQRCVRLLRKTRLQVRVVVEVFHCKSPRHMLTEVIDFLSPTLTILGSRGRSALKGVLLGSFSNYLVTKSSVPVMVARKRLRKHSKQRLHKDGLPIAGTGDGRMRYGRMSNVLEAPVGPSKRGNRLVGAKVD